MKSKYDPLLIAEEDDLRSACIHKLVQKSVSFNKRTSAAAIPKVIIQFWHDLDDIPMDVLECLDSWKSLAPQGFKRVLFDDRTARKFIKERFDPKYVTAFDLCHHPAMRCDYFRLCYMLDSGGFYVDADELYQGSDCQSLFSDTRLKLQPLCYDKLSESMVQTCVFLKHGAYSPHWIFYVNNNPIISPPDHRVIQLALERATWILLSRIEELPDIQSTTGPGNLSANLVRHWVCLEREEKDQDFEFIHNWDSHSISKWPLSYRNDKRNWRIWNSLSHQGIFD